MTSLYHSQNTSLPAGFQIIEKTEYHTDKKDGKEKRRCPVPKNQYCREMIKQAVVSQIRFRYVLTDVWFASAENMMFIRHEAEKDSVMPVKTNRKIAMTYDDRRHGRYVRTDKAVLMTDTPVEIFMEDTDFPMLMVKQVFADKDGSTGILYLVTGDTTLTYKQITAICRKRRNAECYHKSLKQNASPEKSPTQTVTTQKNHFFASLCGYVKLEILKLSNNLNHFAPENKNLYRCIADRFCRIAKITADDNFCVR